MRQLRQFRQVLVQYNQHFQLLKQLDKIRKYIKTKNIFYITVKKIQVLLNLILMD
jgi:hypothetical protein